MPPPPTLAGRGCGRGDGNLCRDHRHASGRTTYPNPIGEQDNAVRHRLGPWRPRLNTPSLPTPRRLPLRTAGVVTSGDHVTANPTSLVKEPPGGPFAHR